METVSFLIFWVDHSRFKLSITHCNFRSHFELFSRTLRIPTVSKKKRNSFRNSPTITRAWIYPAVVYSNYFLITTEPEKQKSFLDIAALQNCQVYSRHKQMKKWLWHLHDSQYFVRLSIELRPSFGWGCFLFRRGGPNFGLIISEVVIFLARQKMFNFAVVLAGRSNLTFHDWLCFHSVKN